MSASDAKGTAAFVLEENAVPELFYFGANSGLFGAFHQAKAGARVGAVICPPIGQEHLRSHRTLLRLATALATAGCPTLRFDYRGVGDSDGLEEECTLATMVEDTRVAVEMLVDGAAVESVALIGVRLGAVVATHAQKLDSAVSALALWHPVVSGPAYLRELERGHEQALAHLTGPPRTTQDSFESIGFVYSRQLVCELKSTELSRLTEPTRRSWTCPSPIPGWSSTVVETPSMTSQTHFWVHSYDLAPKLAVPKEEISRIRRWILD